MEFLKKQVNLEREHILVFLVGVCLSISQFIMIRDFVTILYGEEVVIVLVTAAFFLGLSLGYLFALKFSKATFEVLFAVCAFLHLTFPFSYRYLAVWISSFSHNGLWFMILLFVYALVFGSIFATFIPRLIHKDNSNETVEHRLKVFYSVELAGFVGGFALVGWSWNKPAGFLLPLYWILLCVILHLAIKKTLWTTAYGACLLTASFFVSSLDNHSTVLLYQKKHGKRNSSVLLSINSPYQKVEVVRDRRGVNYLYLDGLQNLNAGDLEELNYFIAEVPAKLIRPEKTLLVGNGTLSSVPKVYPWSGHVTSVELDPGVLLAGREYFTSPSRLAGLGNWELHVNDGKYYMWKSKDVYDLIVMDVPSPLTIQEALLHSVEFYRLAKNRLSQRGVIAVQLSGPLARNNRTPARVVAALKEVFNEVLVIHSKKADRGFAYAGTHLPFSGDDIRRVTFEHEPGLKIIPSSKVPSYLSRAVPLAVDNLDLVLRRGWERFSDRYFDED